MTGGNGDVAVAGARGVPRRLAGRVRVWSQTRRAANLEGHPGPAQERAAAVTNRPVVFVLLNGNVRFFCSFEDLGWAIHAAVRIRELFEVPTFVAAADYGHVLEGA